jgi:hypothetical protein
MAAKLQIACDQNTTKQKHKKRDEQLYETTDSP